MKKLYLALVLTALVVLFAGSALAADIAIDAVNFPDANFRNTLVAKYPAWAGDGALTPAEIAAVNSIFIDNSNISSFKGLEFFTALEYLDVSQNPVTFLDISKNTNLLAFRCAECGLSALDVSKNTKLTGLDCADNTLSSLNVSNLIDLDYLDCTNNALGALDISKNTKLIELYTANNKLTALDISKNTNLIMLYAHNNKLTNLDISNNTKLTNLIASNNSLTSLDTSKNNNMGSIKCLNQVRTITITEYPDSSYTVKAAPYVVKFADLDPNIDPAKIANLNGAVLDAANKTFTNVVPGTDITYKYLFNCPLPTDPKSIPQAKAACYMDVTIIVKGVKGTLPPAPPVPPVVSAPKTGDNTPLALYIGIALSAVLLSSWAYTKRRKNN